MPRCIKLFYALCFSSNCSKIKTADCSVLFHPVTSESPMQDYSAYESAFLWSPRNFYQTAKILSQRSSSLLRPLFWLYVIHFQPVLSLNFEKHQNGIAFLNTWLHLHFFCEEVSLYWSGFIILSLFLRLLGSFWAVLGSPKIEKIRMFLVYLLPPHMHNLPLSTSLTIMVYLLQWICQYCNIIIT